MTTIEELQEQLNKDLEKANSTFEKNLLKHEYEHRKKLLGLKEEIDATKSGESDFECIGCGS